MFRIMKKYHCEKKIDFKLLLKKLWASKVKDFGLRKYSKKIKFKNIGLKSSENDMNHEKRDL